MVCYRFPTSVPAPVHKAPPRSQRSRWATEHHNEWQDATLFAPGSDGANKTPVPPPRKRKRRKVNSLEVLTSQIDQVSLS